MEIIKDVLSMQADLCNFLEAWAERDLGLGGRTTRIESSKLVLGDRADVKSTMKAISKNLQGN